MSWKRLVRGVSIGVDCIGKRTVGRLGGGTLRGDMRAISTLAGWSSSYHLWSPSPIEPTWRGDEAV